MRTLRNDELAQVSGGFGPIGGGLIGGATYAIGTMLSGGHLRGPDLAGAVAFGAVTSGFSSMAPGIVGAARYAKLIHANALGVLAGSATSGALGGVHWNMTGGSKISSQD